MFSNILIIFTAVNKQPLKHSEEWKKKYKFVAKIIKKR